MIFPKLFEEKLFEKENDMPLPEDKAWFPRRNFDSGWSLTKTWQGWAVLTTNVLLFLVGFVFLRENNFDLWLIYLAILSVVTAWLCWWKGARRGLK